jgi:PilZ domain
MDNPQPPKRSNRRGAQRRPTRRAIRLECRRGSSGLGANLASQCLDVSLSGVQILSKEPLRSGEEVEVILDGYGFRGAIRRLGEVRWIVPIEGGGCRVGVRFSKYLTYPELQNLSN